MHINCNKEDLAYSVQVVSRAVSTKNTLPILGGIMLHAQHNHLTLKATDLEIAVECSVDIELLEEGTVVLPGRYFTEMVKRLPSGPINIKKNNNLGIDIKYEQSELSINGYDPDEFPAFPEIEGNITGIIDQNQLKKMIKQVYIAASNDETRPVFTGILMEVDKNKVTFVATDTHRLALKEGIWKGSPVPEKTSIIIPSKAMMEVARIIGDDADPLHISLSNNQVYFRAGNLSLISRVIEGQYPSYSQVIPDSSQCKSKIRIKTKKFLEAAERASLLVRDEFKERYSLIKIIVENNNNLIINSNSPEIGRIYEEIPVFLEGEPVEIVFNSRYLIDALKIVDSEEIYMELTGALSPGIIRNVESSDYIYLILPVRTA